MVWDLMRAGCTYSGYFENVPTERLLGEGVLPEHLNDDVLGKTLMNMAVLSFSMRLFSRL